MHYVICQAECGAASITAWLYGKVSTYYLYRMESTQKKQKFKSDPKLKLMEPVRQVLRYHHYAYNTEKTYSD